MAKIKEKYITYFSHRGFSSTFIFSLSVLVMSLVINFYAGSYAAERESNSVTDIILSNTKVHNVDNLFVYGSIVLVSFIALICLYDLKRAPFIMKSIALFVIVRSLFISLTHIGPFPTQVPIDSIIMGKLSFGADLFFSGHTGLPFLMALIFWNNVIMRYLFILTSIFFAVVVLLGHLHYSIDVASAFFITYAIYHIAVQIFKKDLNLFQHGIESDI